MKKYLLIFSATFFFLTSGGYCATEQTEEQAPVFENEKDSDFDEFFPPPPPPPPFEEKIGENDLENDTFDTNRDEGPRRHHGRKHQKHHKHRKHYGDRINNDADGLSNDDRMPPPPPPRHRRKHKRVENSFSSSESTENFRNREHFPHSRRGFPDESMNAAPPEVPE